MYEFTFQLEEIYILITESSVSVPQLVCCCGNEVGCCCALSSRQWSVSRRHLPVMRELHLKCNRRHNPVISVEICLKYQQGVSRHPRIICQIWSLKNIKHFLNTVHWTRSVFNCHSSDKLSVLYGIPFLISILIMGILSSDGLTLFYGIWNGWWSCLWNYSNISSHQTTCCSLMLTNAKWMGEMEGLWMYHQFPSGQHLHVSISIDT